MLFYTLFLIGSLQMPIDQGNEEIKVQLAKTVAEYQQTQLSQTKLDVSPPAGDTPKNPNSSEVN
jgi:hypothetical protein